MTNFDSYSKCGSSLGYWYHFFNGCNYCHFLVGLAGEILAQVYHEPTGQAWRSIKMRAGICNLFQGGDNSSPTLCEEHRGIFNIHHRMPADGTPSLTSTQGTGHTLMNCPACESLRWQFIVYSLGGIQTQKETALKRWMCTPLGPRPPCPPHHVSTPMFISTHSYLICSYAACDCLAASFFLGHSCATDTVTPVNSKLVLISPTSEGWQGWVNSPGVNSSTQTGAWTQHPKILRS